MVETAPALVWRAAGEPAHKYTEEPHSGACATCGGGISIGVPIDEINNPTFSNHAEFFRYGTHACRACAWLYGIGKGRPGNIMAAGTDLYRPVISEKSATDERPTWLDTLRSLSGDMPVAGVLTTDTKPRVWPRMRIASIRAFGLYVHAPEYAVSEYRSFSLADLGVASSAIRKALDMGFTKRRIHLGLLADFTRAKRHTREVMSLEQRLRMLRDRPEFVPALIVTYTELRKEEDGDPGDLEPAGAEGGEARKDGDRLFQL